MGGLRRPDCERGMVPQMFVNLGSGLSSRSRAGWCLRERTVIANAPKESVSDGGFACLDLFAHQVLYQKCRGAGERA